MGLVSASQAPAGHLEHVAQPVRGGLVGPEQPEVVRVLRDHVAEERAEHPRRFARGRPGLRHVDRVVAEVRQDELAEQHAPIRVRGRAHPALAVRRQVGELGDQRSVLVEELVRLVAPHPLFEHAEMVGVVAHVGHRDLVRPPRVLDGQAVDLFRAGPALRRAQDDHRPARPSRLGSRLAGVRLDGGDLGEGGVQRGREALMDDGRSLAVEAARDEDGAVPVPLEQRHELRLGNPGEDGRIRDLVAVQMQDRQHRAVGLRIQELVRVPAGRERARLGLAVADDAGDEQLGIVEGSAVRVRERVAEFAALVDRARCLGRDVARDPAGEGELTEELVQPLLVHAHARIDLAVGALEVRVRDERRPTVARPGHVEHLEVARPDRPVEVRVDEVQSRGRPEMPEQARLDVLGRERLAEQRVVEQEHLSNREVVRRTPVRVEKPKLLAREWARLGSDAVERLHASETTPATDTEAPLPA